MEERVHTDKHSVKQGQQSVIHKVQAKRLVKPEKPKAPCGKHCCFHPADALECSDTTAEHSHMWKAKCRRLACIYQSNPCEIARFLNASCAKVYAFICDEFHEQEKMMEHREPKKGQTKGKGRWGKKKSTTVQKKRKRFGHNSTGRQEGPFSIVSAHGDVSDKYDLDGCSCKGNCDTKACPCRGNQRECDPDKCSCRGCVEGNYGVDGCRNRRIQLKQHLRVLLGKSEVEGWGAFLRDGAKKNDFICEYFGEHISEAESERRGMVYNKTGVTFLFNLNTQRESDKGSLDALRLGGKAKFINHPPEHYGNKKQLTNCEVQVWRVDGEKRVILVANRDIKPMEELFFDYNLIGNNPEWMEKMISTTEANGGSRHAASAKSLKSKSLSKNQWAKGKRRRKTQ